MGAEVATSSDEETGAAQPSPHWGQDPGPSSLAGPVFSAITLAVEPVAHLPQGLASLHVAGAGQTQSGVGVLS